MEWIRVEDRLPEDNQRVLVYRPEMETADTGPISVQFGWTCARKHCDVSHWMPLPEPPGELPDICAACRHYEGRSGTYRNGDSIFRYEFVEADSCCSKWEGEKQ